eukprot:scaffold34817_cov50-Phaeocystis_antarctica.AAC.1
MGARVAVHARDEVVGEQVLSRRRHRLRSVRGRRVGGLRQADAYGVQRKWSGVKENTGVITVHICLPARGRRRRPAARSKARTARCT